MDVDLSTNLESFLPLVAPIVSGHSELAIGTRLARQARVRRQIKREVLSRGYNTLVHAGFRSGFSDAQCGFKAVRADVARLLVPHVEDDGWFFDTELLLLAERNGLRIHEVPVDWVEDLDSRVDLVLDDRRRPARTLARAALVPARRGAPAARSPATRSPGRRAMTAPSVPLAGAPARSRSAASPRARTRSRWAACSCSRRS